MNAKFKEFGFKLLVTILIILGISLLLCSLFFSQSFFLKYSPDGVLKPETLHKIKLLRFSLVIASAICLLLIILSIKFKNGIKNFIDKHKSVIINLLLLLSVLIIIILLGELALRVIIYDETSGHGASPGSLKFNQKHVELNKEGFRDVDYSFSKPNNTMRIAVVGDSFTFGMGVNNVNDTYPKVLERDLASLNLTRNFEVLNFGIPGYDTKDHIKTIEDHVLKYNPDVIVIGYVLNDLPNPENIDVKYQKIELPFIGFWLRSSSYLYYFIESRLNELLRGNSPDYNYESIMSKLYNSSLNKNESDRIYKQIADVANQNNITVLVVTFPIIYKLNNYPFKEAHKHVDELAYKNHFLHIDLLKDYQRYRVEDLVVNQYDAHPNELGQKIAADVISDYLMRKGVLLQSI